MRLIIQAVASLLRKFRYEVDALKQWAVHSDWNQNDETAADYVKNRPFYSNTTRTTYVPEQTIEVTGGGDYELEITENFHQNVGENFEVVFDGTSYYGTVYQDSDVCYRYDFNTNEGTFYWYDGYRLVVPSTVTTGSHTIALYILVGELVKIPAKYINETDPTVPAWAKRARKPTYTASEVGAMARVDPTAIGSFSMNRKSNTTIGQYSHAEGYENTASGHSSHAEGNNNVASSYSSHAEGGNNTASDQFSHAEGYENTASGHSSHAEGGNNTASGTRAHAQGYKCVASGADSHAEGWETIAESDNQHAQGKFNIKDVYSTYAHIVGNGTSDTARSNAHTLDWDGNAWYAGTIEGTALILKSSTEGSTKRFLITVNDEGEITSAEITE